MKGYHARHGLRDDWNQVHLIARSTIVKVFNGGVTGIVIDDDTKNRSPGGLIV